MVASLWSWPSRSHAVVPDGIVRSLDAYSGESKGVGPMTSRTDANQFWWHPKAQP